MTSHIIFGFISGGISLFAYGIYIYAIWYGDTRPSRSSWWILTVVWGVLLLSSLSIGDSGIQSHWTSYVERGITIAYVLGSLVIAISTIWRGSVERWGVLDYLCAVSAGIALLLYFVFDQPVLSFAMSLVADIFGIVPTVRNAYRHPEQEDFAAWGIECAASFLALFAISVWAFSLESASQFLPVFYLVIANSLITILIWRGRRI